MFGLVRKSKVFAVINDHCEEVLNSTACIAGVLAGARKTGVLKFSDVTDQLRRIEKSANYVRLMNKG